MIKRFLGSAAIAAALMLTATVVSAQEKVKIGLMLTLSGPNAVLGEQARDGFNLAIKQLGGKMQGRDVEVLVVDDELKPDVAVSKLEGLLSRDKVNFVVGPIFSNIAIAIAKPIAAAGAFMISPNAGPSPLAGSDCNPNVFSASYQNDQVHEILGKVAQDRGYKKVYVLVPNYQAGKDSAAGFRRHFKGEVIESYVPLNTLDFQSELVKIATSKPDAVFTFMPGGLGVNLVKQYKQANLTGRIPFLSAFTVDESTLPAQQDAALGMFGGSNWAPDLDNAANKKFVSTFEAEYKYPPSMYAANAYDVANIIDAALKTTGGKTADQDALRAAIRHVKFDSVRGSFKFNTNNFPIQDLYLTQVVKRADGKFVTKYVSTVLKNYEDAYASKCKMTK